MKLKVIQKNKILILYRGQQFIQLGGGLILQRG